MFLFALTMGVASYLSLRLGRVQPPDSELVRLSTHGVRGQAAIAGWPVWFMVVATVVAVVMIIAGAVLIITDAFGLMT